jgi:excinuclease ABC subunit C
MQPSISFSKIPTNPGCYIFKDNESKIIYIGKAKNLKKRVSSYFQKDHPNEKTNILVSLIKDIDFIVTDSETEAFILESNLIRKNQPKFNIDLKDSKRYAYIEITNEEFPRLIIARKRGKEGKYFGPFVSSASRDNILYVLKKIFKLRTCNKLPKKPCLRYSIGLCEAPCVNNIPKEKYNEKIDAIKMIFSGKTRKLIKKLEKQMKTESKNKNFEKAIELRNQIHALDQLSERQKMERGKFYDEDIINYIIKDNEVYLILFNVDKGTIINKQEFVFPETPEFFEEFLLQYYTTNKVPKSIIVPENISRSLIEVLERKRGSKIMIEVPKIGEKKQLLNLVSKNIEISFFSSVKELQDLKETLNLPNIPTVIECFDISHLSGTSLVGSMVQFRNAKPDKSNYRRFKIKTFEGVDDTRAIAEIVSRRYYSLKTSSSSLPDLIVIDGGKAQLNFAVNELKRLNINVPIISIAKRLEEIFIPGQNDSIILPIKSGALKLLQKIRDEAHRFAIKYNRLLREKEMIEG